MKPRKRSRSDDCDSDDSMPISKRINGLHIRYSTEKEQAQGFNNNSATVNVNGFECCSDNQQPSTSSLAVDYTQNRDTSLSNSYSYNGDVPLVSQTSHSNQEVFQENSNCSSSFNGSNQQESHGPCVFNGISNSLLLELQAYQPELTRHENPHYYQINELLFNAHRDKVKRVQEDT